MGAWQMTDLTKILETMEQQNEVIAKLKAENEQLRQQVATERSHKLAYQRRLRELEPPPNERKEQEQQENQEYVFVNYDDEQFWDNLNNLADDEKYKALKKFVDEVDILWGAVTQKFLEKYRQQYKKEYNDIKQEIKSLESEKPKFFGLVADKEKEAKISSLKSKQGIAKLNYDSYDPAKENKKVKEQALEYMCQESKLKDFRKKQFRARAFVKEYEERNAKEW